jgi:hypothetical protein
MSFSGSAEAIVQFRSCRSEKAGEVKRSEALDS